MSNAKVYVQLNAHTVTFLSFPDMSADVIYVDDNKHNKKDARRIYNELLNQGYTLTSEAPVRVCTRPFMSPMEIYNNGKMRF